MYLLSVRPLILSTEFSARVFMNGLTSPRAPALFSFSLNISGSNDHPSRNGRKCAVLETNRGGSDSSPHWIFLSFIDKVARECPSRKC